MYKKTAIRQHFTQYLKDNVPSVATRVFSGRIAPKQKDDPYPYLIVFAKDEDIAEYYTSHTERVLELKVGVVVNENGNADSDFDEITENLEYEVEIAMSKIITSGDPIAPDNFKLFNDIVLDNSQTDSSFESGNDIGGGMLNYVINYDYENPVDPLVLQDFDVVESVQNMVITNEGVPQ